MSTPQERKQVERQARRRRIQEAARGVFAERGYAKTSIEQIAKQSGLSVGAIYLYFRSKEDLYVSLLERVLDDVIAELRKIRAAGGPDALRNAWSYLVQWAAADVESTRVLRLVCQPGVRPQLSDETARAAATRIAGVCGELAALVRDERGRDGVAEADLLWALFLGLLQQADGRGNLGIDGPPLADAAHAAFSAIEPSLRSPAAPMAA
ncbi:MAG: TetR/AcrR family transcriptional regulator [Deltaproteobacteria bacterium]|nr:MAG: TetR/AcrR family transcriptional regulator [Deltaproteobacteria bacterium]